MRAYWSIILILVLFVSFLVTIEARVGANVARAAGRSAGSKIGTSQSVGVRSFDRFQMMLPNEKAAKDKAAKDKLKKKAGGGPAYSASHTGTYACSAAAMWASISEWAPAHLVDREGVVDQVAAGHAVAVDRVADELHGTATLAHDGHVDRVVEVDFRLKLIFILNP